MVELARVERLMAGEDPVSDDLLALLRPSAWMRRAASRGAGVDTFFIESGASSRPAKATCAECPVRRECLDFALAQGERLRGIWGGTSERERRQMRARATTA
jgi:WhiB family redox-sensing transcriptional regulator